MVEIRDIAHGELQNLDLGQLLVGRQGGQQLAQLAEGRVEGLHSDPLPCGVGQSVLLRGAAAAATLLPRQHGAPAGQVRGQTLFWV